MAWARKWLAPGTTSLRSSAGSAQLRCASRAMVTDWDQASVLVRRVRGETMVGANCLRAVTTSQTESPHRPLSARRRATSATACWPRVDWSRASRYSVVLRHSESAAGGGMTDASHSIQASFMTAPCSVAPLAQPWPDPHGGPGPPRCGRPGVLGRAAALSGALLPGRETRGSADRAGSAEDAAEKVGAPYCRFSQSWLNRGVARHLRLWHEPERGIGLDRLSAAPGADSERRREPAPLVDRALGVQLRGHVGAADHVHFHAGSFHRRLQFALRLLSGADHDVVDVQHLFAPVNGQVQAAVVDAPVLHAAEHVRALVPERG